MTFFFMFVGKQNHKTRGTRTFEKIIFQGREMVLFNSISIQNEGKQRSEESSCAPCQILIAYSSARE